MSSEVDTPTSETHAKCAGCGVERPLDEASTIPRPPCPECGAVGVQYELKLVAVARSYASAGVTLTAGKEKQGRAWKRRWEEVQRDLTAVETPHTEVLSGDAITAAAHRLHAFFVAAYHIKDALIADAASTGVPKKKIEDAITNDPDLALLADLANLEKHYKLAKNPRSAHTPVIGNVRGTSSAPTAGWSLEMPITHGSKTMDGVGAARAAVDAWRKHLALWGLI